MTAMSVRSATPERGALRLSVKRRPSGASSDLPRHRSAFNADNIGNALAPEPPGPRYRRAVTRELGTLPAPRSGRAAADRSAGLSAGAREGAPAANSH